MDTGFIILLALAIPIVVIWPLLIWGGAVVSVIKTVRAKAKSKASATQKAD